MASYKIEILKKHFAFFILLQIVCGCNNSDKTEIKNASRNLIINDTLKLSAHFDECGEFGGHREQIRIYNLRSTNPNGVLNILNADLLVDTIKCPSNRKRKFKKTKTKRLADNDKAIVLDYMNDLFEHSFNEELISNAGKSYTIECKMPRISMSYIDDEQGWNGFYNLKNSLFKK
ncbi:hypothetical protein [Hymenobacter coccineus]|uniref:hypothetical protein n=1 Tax=Hymenobacter coccineus TaxID=1908235 RepID=UPI000F76C614|nr:hypothetical protein [Hymenobacter coccineus]